jgi:hypothetical protein
MSKRKKQKCPHPSCVGGFVYETVEVAATRDERHAGIDKRNVTHRYLCPICGGLAQVRRKR